MEEVDCELKSENKAETESFEASRLEHRNTASLDLLFLDNNKYVNKLDDKSKDK